MKTYTREEAIQWVKENYPKEIDNWELYFEYNGVIAGKGDVYIQTSTSSFITYSRKSIPKSTRKTNYSFGNGLQILRHG
jgi:hypothetical protein